MAKNGQWSEMLQQAVDAAVDKAAKASTNIANAANNATSGTASGAANNATPLPPLRGPGAAKDTSDAPSAAASTYAYKPGSSGGGRGPGGARLEERRGPGWWPLWVLGGLVALSFVRSFVVVGAGERAVIYNRFGGVQKGALGEGLHVLIPFVQSATVYDVKTHTYTMSASANEANTTHGTSNDALTALTRDGLPVSLEMSVQFHPDPDKVDELHQNIGREYIEKVVRPQTRSHVRMVIAKYPVTSVYGVGRARIAEEINARLRDRFAENGVVLESALLRDVTFSPQFQQAIESKQVAQQEVSRMAFVVEQAEKERRRKIIQAEGEAESIRLKARALARNPGLTQYEYVQNLPSDVRTIITDSRTIVNLGDVGTATPRAQNSASNAAASLPEPSASGAPGAP